MIILVWKRFQFKQKKSKEKKDPYANELFWRDNSIFCLKEPGIVYHRNKKFLGAYFDDDKCIEIIVLLVLAFWLIFDVF